MKKVLVYTGEQIVMKNQEELTEIVEFMIEDEEISFNKVPLKLEDLQVTPVKMDDMRVEVQDSLEEIDLRTTKHPWPIYISIAYY